MSEAALHPRKSCWTPASAFIFFFLSLPLLYNELRLATRDGSNPLLFSAAPQPYFRRANAWYRHLYPLQFFLSHPCYVSTDQVWHILKWVIKNGRVSFIDNEQEVLEGINKLDVQEGDGIHFSASCFMGHSWTFFFFTLPVLGHISLLPHCFWPPDLVIFSSLAQTTQRMESGSSGTVV